jgi:hypothetical protein
MLIARAQDELGIYRCPAVDYSLTLDGGALRASFWNPRAAFFAAAWAGLAEMGVEGMGAR